jgi:hypothetical protein
VVRPQALRQDAPDPNPEEAWAIDETVQGIFVAPGEKHWPASFLFLAVSSGVNFT